MTLKGACFLGGLIFQAKPGYLVFFGDISRTSHQNGFKIGEEVCIEEFYNSNGKGCSLAYFRGRGSGNQRF